jgi:hypothetical protein
MGGHGLTSGWQEDLHSATIHNRRRSERYYYEMFLAMRKDSKNCTMLSDKRCYANFDGFYSMYLGKLQDKSLTAGRAAGSLLVVMSKREEKRKSEIKN